MTAAEGRAGYEAYCASTGGRSAVTGDPLPSWDDQSPQIREAWAAAGRAERDAYWGMPPVRDTIYLAGPMSGIDEFNFPAFRQAAATIRGCRDTTPHWVLSPHELNPPGFDPRAHVSTPGSYQEQMRIDLVAMLRLAVMLVRLPGWETSTGALTEVGVARVIGIPVVDMPDLSVCPICHPSTRPVPAGCMRPDCGCHLLPPGPTVGCCLMCCGCPSCVDTRTRQYHQGG